MIGTLFDYIIGFSTFTVYAEKNEIPNIINRIASVSPKNVRIYDDRVWFVCPLRYSKEAQELISSCGVDVKVRNFGISVLYSRLIKRKGIVVSALLCVLLWALFSNIIWSIEVAGNESISDGAIKTSLYSHGVRVGAFIPSLNTKKLVLDFLVDNNEISWMHLNINGTDAIAEITERKSPPERIDKIKSSNLIAKCDGVVVRADVYSGGAEVQSGDVVQKGQLLVSSFFETRKSGELLRRAKGNVYATTYPSYTFMVSKVMDDMKDEKGFSKFKLCILSYKIPIPSLSSCDKYKSYKTEKETIKVKIGNIIEFPFFFDKTNYRETVYCVKEISSEQATDIFEREYELWKRNFTKINKENIQTEETETHYIFTVNLECTENIAIEIPYDFNAG